MYSFILGSLLICVFLINYTWPISEQNIALSNLIFFGVIGFTLFLYFRESILSITYFSIIKQSVLIALVGGVIVSIFFIVYVNFIQPSYFEEIAISEMEKMRKEGFDENAIRRTLRVIGVAKKYHIKELSLILSTLIRTLALSLILAPFIINLKADRNQVYR